MSQPGTGAVSGFAALAGQFLLQPGQSAPIVGTRPIVGADVLSRLLKGQLFAAAQARLGHVFTLCAHAHQRACALAFAAALPESAAALPATAAPAQSAVAVSAPTPASAPLPLTQLRWETARDHLRTIGLEWPQRIGDAALQQAGLAWLQAGPLPLTGAAPHSAQAAQESLVALNAWLADGAPHRPLAQCVAEPPDDAALAGWCLVPTQGGQAAFPAQCLARWHAQASPLTPRLRALNLLSPYASTQRAHLHLLGQAIAADPGFAQRPQWLGICAETGPWTRLRHQRRSVTASGASAWSRLAARWLELLEIAAAPALADDATHDPLLSSGAQNLGDGQALAWCEMARGLLLHWVQLDGQGAVAQYRVLSPTEWNFHPQGALALALAERAPQDLAAAQTLAAAFDPCVACSVATAPTPERAHA